ncbi:acyl-CoA dehydrogenase domain protein [Leptothrix cholodnii SP-6]|uniref:Acyl-CoA dehydrogenase domain protein n=1 Tax=Leptothrix cholodnii (strain ATCC 51168 / LMG 8142 / SP-6) TaxID=395495 RepID=B1Y5C1_LEPCP|nr:acyl-CoA dehydrogenase family protein [Leptothrix cholodnii]ACB33509.1 acyl-CoA dehydrogenase domain protein [Leptothrix cholodnii SP-6]
MDLNFSAEERAFRADIRAWLASHLPDELSARVRAGQRLTRDDLQRWARILGAQGWLGAGWPVAFGGPGWSAVQRHLFDEECARADAPPVLPFGPVMLAPVLMAFGTPAQQQRFLPGIASGDVWWCQGYSEPGAGSDLASLRTRAERAGSGAAEHYRVNGQKTWTTLAQHADWIFCLVRTGHGSKPQAGISFLLIDLKSPGVTVRPIRLLDGEAEVNEVFFDDVQVPLDQRIGAENQGWACAKYLLAHERTHIADVPRAKRGLEHLKRIARLEGLWDDSRWRDRIALLEVDIVALEMMVLRALCAERGGGPGLDIAALLKIRASEIQQHLAELTMLAAGPQGLPCGPEAPASRYFNQRKTTIYGGSNEVQRNIVAQAVLG